MAAILLSIAFSIVIGGLVWMLVGTKFKFSDDDVHNDVLNLLLWVGVTLVIVMPFVILIIGGYL